MHIIRITYMYWQKNGSAVIITRAINTLELEYFSVMERHSKCILENCKFVC